MRLLFAFAGLLALTVGLMQQIESAPSARSADAVPTEVEKAAVASARSSSTPMAAVDHGAVLRYRDCVSSTLSELVIQPCYQRNATIDGRPAALSVAADLHDFTQRNARYKSYVADPRLVLADHRFAAAVVVETAEHPGTSRVPNPAPSIGAIGVLARFGSDGRVTEETRALAGRFQYGRTQFSRTELLEDLPGVVVASGSDKEARNLGNILELLKALEGKQLGAAIARVRSDIRYVDPLYERIESFDAIDALWADRFMRDEVVGLEISTAFAASDWVFVDVAVLGAPKGHYFLFAELDDGVVIRWIGLPG